MANPILPTNGTHELQERYAKSIVAIKRIENVVRNLFRKDYEGNPLAGAVKIPTRNTEVTVASYDVASGVSLTTSATSYTTVTITQDKAVNELIDGYEANAVPDNIVAQRLDSAGYSLGRAQELYAIGQLEANGTQGATTTETAANDVYSSILTDVKSLHKLGIAFNDLRIVISDDIWQKLLTDTKFSNTASTIGAELIRSGVVSKIGGVNVYVSSHMRDEDDGGDGYNYTTEWMVFSPLWAQTVEDWKVLPTINDLKDGSHIGASALQGRMVYEDTLLDSTTCLVKVIKTAQ